MRTPHTLASKLVLIGGAFLILALTSIGLTLWVSWQLEGSAAAVNEAGRLRMQTWRLAATLNVADPSATQARVARFDASLALLRDGDASRPLFVPWDTESRALFTAIGTEWQGLRQDWLAAATLEPALTVARAEHFAEQVDRFVGAIEASASKWTAIMSLFQMAMMALAVGSAVALLYAGRVLVLDPLDTLRRGLDLVQRGDLTTRVDVPSRDEFGTLADGFNRMTETLHGLYGGLERKVGEKTARLEEQRRQLASLYAASDFLARATTLDDMAQGFVVQMRQLAQADAAAIRWSDEGNQRYLLLAGDCLPQTMANDETCLQTGECLCGQARAGASTRVIPIRSAAMPTLGHCARAGFETLVSVPVLLQQRMLGEIDLFYRAPITLNPETRSLFDALASHLASAMEGLRADALERESVVAQERSLLARELHDSIAQSLAFLKIQVQLLREAIGRADAVAVERTLSELDAGVRESTADVRELLLHFRTRTNSEDILPAIRTTLHKFEHQTGLRTHLSVEGQGMPLDPDIQVQVLHVVQEALSNVRKHAGAEQVWIEVQQGRDWRVEVRDDGQGFDPGVAPPGEMHVGLRIMRERAARIGAQVEIDSVPGAGTCVALTLPERQATVQAVTA